MLYYCFSNWWLLFTAACQTYAGTTDCSYFVHPLGPDVEYIPHENTSLYYVQKLNHKWVKLKSYKGKRKPALALSHIHFGRLTTTTKIPPICFILFCRDSITKRFTSSQTNSLFGLPPKLIRALFDFFMSSAKISFSKCIFLLRFPLVIISVNSLRKCIFVLRFPLVIISVNSLRWGFAINQ